MRHNISFPYLPEYYKHKSSSVWFDFKYLVSLSTGLHIVKARVIGAIFQTNFRAFKALLHTSKTYFGPEFGYYSSIYNIQL